MAINWDYEPKVIDNHRGNDDDLVVQQHGKINFRYISRPPQNFWFVRPHALNYFKDGVLHRTKGERLSSKIELFLDLLYVGLIANLAGEATKEATGLALLKYVLFFIPIYQVWNDVKDFVNYYYNEDFTQKTALFFVLCILMLYANSHQEVSKSRHGAALVIVPYMVARLMLAGTLFFYSFWIPQHRPQMRAYGTTVVFTSCLWIIVIFVGNRAKVGVSIAIFVLEFAFFSYCYSPLLKKLLKLTMSTALNLEHEIERYSAFVTIAIGEFTYKVVALAPLGAGFSVRFARGVFCLMVAYMLFWIYNYGSTSQKYVHPFRRSARTAIVFVFVHMPLIALIVLAADAAGDLLGVENGSTKRGATGYHEEAGEGESGTEEHMKLLIRGAEFLIKRAEEEKEAHNMFGLLFYFTGGIAVSLICCWVIGMCFQDDDEKDTFYLPRWARIGWRLPIGIAIVMISFAEMDCTLLMGLVCILMGFVFIWELVFQHPRGMWFKFHLTDDDAIQRENEEEALAAEERLGKIGSREHVDHHHLGGVTSRDITVKESDHIDDKV